MIRILISDDIKIIRDSLKEIIKKISKVELVGSVKSLEEELEMIEKFKPDLVLTDIVKDGKEKILKVVKEHSDKKSNTKFIFITGMEKEYVRYQIAKNKLNNVIGIVHKPFIEQEIINIVNTVSIKN